MNCRFSSLSIAILLLAASASLARPAMQVEMVGTFPNVSGFDVLRRAALGNQEIFEIRAGGNRKLYRFDGLTAAEIIDTYSDSQPSLLFRAELNGELFYPGRSPSGTALYKTNGMSTQFVADFDPATNFDQTIQDMNAADNFVFIRGVGVNGMELFRTNGVTSEELDLRPGPLSSFPSNFRRLGTELLFTATDGTGARALYRIRGGVPESLGHFGQLDSHIKEFQGNLYWTDSGKLYRYDGNFVTPLLETSSFSSFDLNGINSNFFLFQGRDATGWNIYTWDGMALRLVLPGAGASPLEEQSNMSQSYYQGAGGLYHITATTATEVRGMPGNSPLEIDPGTPMRINGDVIFKSDGPFGYELYRLDGNVANLLGDINSSGDAFAFSTSFPDEWSGDLFFTASNPGGRGLYLTDGRSIEFVSQVASNTGFQVQQFSDFPFGFPATTNVSQNGTVTPGERFVADNQSVAELASYFNDPAEASLEGRILEIFDSVYYVAPTGNIYLLTAVPEPASLAIALVLLAVAAMRRESGFQRLTRLADRAT